MRYKALSFDGHWVDKISSGEIIFRKTPNLMPADTTLLDIGYAIGRSHDVDADRTMDLLEKCDLDDVEVDEKGNVRIIRPPGVM